MRNPRGPRAASLTVTAALLTALTAGCGGTTGADAAGGGTTGGSLAAQKLTWKDCPAPSASEGSPTPSPPPNGGTWQCATMKAPLDWSRPDGDTIDIALIRAKATGPGRRIGSLIFNFGGPGGSGTDTLPLIAQDYAKLATRYDLVSFDPRGVGRSTAVKCESDAWLDRYFQQDSTPDDAAERTTLLNSTKQFNAACEKNSGRLLPHMRTTDAARDLDLMRQVLGDSKLHYFGISYGTELGGVYAHLFPRHVGRAVFDAVVDPTQSPEQVSLSQAKGFQTALDNFAKDCVSRGADQCPIGSSAQDVQNRIAALLEKLDGNPIPGIFPRRLTQSAATTGIAQALYSKDLWPALTEGLRQAYAGDGQILMLLSDALNGRDENGTYDNLVAANTAVNCADQRQRYTPADVERALPAFRAASPVFGDFLAWSILNCTGWPVPGAGDRTEVSAPGAAPILLIGNTGDPATPYQGMKRMAQALGKGVAVQLTWKGQGHGAYSSKDPCVQNAVNSYLLDGKPPADGTVCS
ncbi:peptidase [Streptomyces sp. F-3]|uniref:alpha/beta hydrolase n=1 Tax=Streptomyces sp. F-3 TaxID=1840095 RepID=UPI0007C305AC|nr:alpha/beta hydrolase [Streptomyces sp. F-3]GAT81008.1 peptidase [Streptomyces sp. F-3]